MFGLDNWDSVLGEDRVTFLRVESEHNRDSIFSWKMCCSSSLPTIQAVQPLPIFAELSLGLPTGRISS